MDAQTRIAYTMAIIGLFGAIAAYLAGTAQQEAVQQERLLAQARMFELKVHQEQVDRWNMHQRVAQKIERYRNEARMLVSAAAGTKRKPTGTDGWAHLEAAEALTFARLWQPLLDFFADPDSDSGFLPPIANALGELGFDVAWDKARVADDPRVWERYEAIIERHHYEFRVRAGAAVTSVFLLVILTLFSLGIDKAWFARISWALLSIALAIAGLGLLIVCQSSLDAVHDLRWQDLLIRLLLFVVIPLLLVFGIRRIPIVAHDEGHAGHTLLPSNPNPRELDISHLRPHAPSTAVEGVLITTIAVAALLSACVWRLYGLAELQGSESASAALREQARMLSAASRDRAGDYRYLESQIQVAREDQARYSFGMIADYVSPSQRARNPVAVAALIAKKNAWQRLLDSRDDHEQILRDTLLFHPSGPGQDVNFPEKLLLSISVFGDTEVPFALWNAAREREELSHLEAIDYLRTLVLLATALYLLGQALGMRNRHAALPLGALGAYLLLLGCGIALHALYGSREDVPIQDSCGEQFKYFSDVELKERFAHYYADGQWRLQTAHADREFLDAAKSFECSAALRPSFAFAHYFMARSVLRQGADGATKLAGAWPSLGEAAHALQERRRAREILVRSGLHPPELFKSAGGDVLLSALLAPEKAALNKPEANPALLEAEYAAKNAVQLARAATYPKARQSEATARLNLGLVYFARGEYGNAKREFETTTNTEYGERSSITFGALNTLELVRSLCLDSWRGVCGGSERIAQLDGLKDLLISGTWQRVASESQLQVVTSHIDVLSIGVLWNGRLNAKPKPNELVFLWYLLDPVSNAWKVIPEISGPLQSERAEATNQEFTDYRSYLLAARPRDCLQQGDYRVEIFAGGKRTFTERFRREGYFDPKFLPESNLALCAPTGWGTQEKRGVVPLTFFGDRRGTGIMVGSAPFFEDTDADRLRLVALLNSSPKGEVRSRSDHCTSPTAPKPVLQRVLRAGHVQALVNAWTGRDKLGYFTVALSDGTNPDDLRECELMRSVEVMDSVEPSH